MVLLEGSKPGLHRIALAAGLAFGERAGAVNLHQHLFASASGAMEAVDVLGDYQFDLTRLLESHDGFVNDVRLRVTVLLPHFEFVFPVFNA